MCEGVGILILLILSGRFIKARKVKLKTQIFGIFEYINLEKTQLLMILVLRN